MNAHSNNNNDGREDELFQSLFAPLNREAPAPDAEFRRKLHAQSLEAFAAQSTEARGTEAGKDGEAGVTGAGGTGGETGDGPSAGDVGEGSAADPAVGLREKDRLIPKQLTKHVSTQVSRRSRMVSIAWRSAAVAAAAGVLAGVWFLAAPDRAKADPTLGEVLGRLAEANALHLSIARDGNAEEAWFSRPDRLRQNHPDGTYLIAQGPRAWLVDEKANRAASRTSALFGGRGKKLDALALLGVGESKELSAALATGPAAREPRGGSACLIYRATVACPQGPVRIEAAVDAASLLLRSLETQVDRDGKVTPVATLTVLAANEPLREELFVVGDSLTEDGRIGKIVDAQGVASLKPVMASRWTPVGDGMVIRPGDWLQTEIRGANAATVRLTRQAEAVIGPGSLVELAAPDRIRLAGGEIRIVASEKAPLELLGPGQEKALIKGRAVYRVQNEKLVRLESDPLWLKSFEGKVVNESIGSLVAKVEGRDVPLTVGYHKVSVDIRDQIARTVVEESFVNHTGARLEGVFYFPLPQDASISGFGMWIGNDLVEADVVEKQRAREIYEQILRERRDPGLLEWSGGNLFKARVFPIEAHSEKRIKITYTQVLPMRGGSYRYSYALQSEMLKQHPLRELQIDVKVNSAMALKGVTCLSHPARLDQTPHSAHVEFTAQEYTPTRDFEVSAEVDAQAGGNVGLVPHRRGEDGYFLLMLTPPAPAGDWERDILPDAPPQEVLLLADTSASMTAEQRNSQAEFIRAILTSLGPKDTFNLAGCDVECDWVFDKPVPADARNIAAAREFLARRASLGWSDLDKAFSSAIQRCGAGTRVIYVGDGIPTTGDANPAAFGKRLKRLYEGHSGTFYAVSVGSTFESGVLQAIASLGGGSMRHVGGERTPRAAALELLGEMARPPLRDLKVEFRGLRTARVYPEELPNVPGGLQQIILGRYLPEGRDQEGEVVVTGMQGDKPVRFAAHVSLKDAEQGNSFIPRLWARMHLDFLLQQGSSQAIRDEIIALSEEYHIMTPYTSLLVLESDADRERFKVARRFQMRDGEKFFAEGRDNANYELVQQQMKRAGTWRLGLRRAALLQLSGLGRDPQVFQQGGQWSDLSSNDLSSLAITGATGGSGGGGWRGGDVSFEWAAKPSARPVATASPSSSPAGYFNGPADLNGGYLGDYQGHSNGELDVEAFMDALAENGRLEGAGHESQIGLPSDENYLVVRDVKHELSDAAQQLSFDGPYGGPMSAAEPVGGLRSAREKSALYLPGMGGSGRLDYRAASSAIGKREYDARSPYRDRISGPGDYGYTQWLSTLFPPVPGAIPEAPLLKDRWPAEARALSDSLLRTAELAEMKDGVTVDRQTESFDPQTGELSYRARSAWLVSPKAWLLRTENDNQQTSVQWCDGNQRAVFQKGFLLGRRRAAVADDLKNPPLDFGVYTFSSLERSCQGAQVELKPQGAGQTLVSVTYDYAPDRETRILVDTERHVVLSIEEWNESKVLSTRKFSEFVEVGGAWWAGRDETLDAGGRRGSLTVLKYAAPAAEDFRKAFARELADLPNVQFLSEPGRLVSEAKQASVLGKADFDDQITLLMHFIRIQQWEPAFERLAAAEKLAADKRGMRFVRDALLQISRKHEDLKKRLFVEAAGLAKQSGEGVMGGAREDVPLADYILGQAESFLETNEMLGLLDALRPVFERQPDHLRGLKRWTLQRMNQLQRVGRNDEALQLLKKLAEQYPLDCAAQVQYSQGLINAGRLEDAYAWLGRCLERKDWLPFSEESLRTCYANALGNQGRYEDLAVFTADWMRRELDGTGAYTRHLAALIRLDRVDDANKLMGPWLWEGRLAGRLPAPVAGRLEAAVSQALGQGYSMYSDRIEDAWQRPLADTAIFFALHPARASVAERIMGDWRFQQTDDCRRVRKWAAETLLADLNKLTPQQAGRLVGWIMPNDPAVEQDTWKRIAAGLHKRWLAAQKPQDRRTLGGTLVQIYSGRLSVAEYLAFLREQLNDKPGDLRPTYARQLFDALTTQPWSQECEDEAMGLIDQLSGAKEPWQRLASAVGALHTLDDRMVQARYTAKMKAIEHPEELPRTELMAKQAENLRLAREELADRLGRETGKRSGGIVKWMEVERMYLDILAGRDLPKAVARCWELLPPQPERVELGEHPELVLDQVLQGRLLVSLANLACRKGADPAQVERLLKFVDQGIALDKDDDRWKLMKYELLIALDRPQELQQALEAWIRGDDGDNRWKISLGYLLAEQGKLAEAIKLFEAVAVVDELGGAEYRALADWYMAVNLREQYRRSMIAAYKMTDEWQLNNYLYSRLRPWQQGDGKPPAELDEQTLLIFAALFEKSGSPQNYLGTLRDYYTATRDFRLLSGLADAVVGHTAGEVYPFLQGMGAVLSEVRDEATVDSIVEYLSKVRPRAKTDVDHRALDLLEALAERRAAELKNQPGPHGQKAVAALTRAFQLVWSPGEERLMADLLGGLGAIAYKPLAREQVRQLEALHRGAAEGSADRLHIAHRLANAYWAYGRADEAIDLLTLALGEFEKASGGVLPPAANDALGTLIDYCQQRRHYDRGERFLLTQLKHPAHQQQRLWLTGRLYQLYVDAVRNGGDVSLGSGAVLYKAAEAKMFADLAGPDQDFRYGVVNHLCGLYRAAHDRKIAGVAGGLREFASRQVPEVLKRQTNSYDAVVSTVASTLRDVAGPRDALAFLIERIEQEPSWFHWNNQDGWNRFGYQLGELRSAVKDLGDLEPRLLKIVVAELKRDLRSGVARNRSMYDVQHNYYWKERWGDFVRAAEEVYAERKASGAGVAYIADYLYRGLNAYGRAIEILFIAHNGKLLDEAGQWRLVTFLHEQKRFGESVALLQAMVEWRPDNIQYCTALMHAYFETTRQAELLGLLEQTDEYFHKPGRWNENAMAALAGSCLENHLYEQSVKYYKELIPLHQRTQPNRGIGNGTLSGYYGQMGRAYAELGRTAEAVDAACGSIISWGPTNSNRSEAVRSLLDVIRQAPKLDEFVAELDRQSVETGLQNPIVRKAVGQVYLEKKEYDKAIAQLKLACEVQPSDMETHRALVACYDQRKDREGAIAQILQSVQLSRREITLYADLGGRLAALERPKDAERAYTSIVEVLPAESESHAALAEIRQQQDRWAEAAAQWTEVARIRALEPTGLLKLGAAQVHLKQWEALGETIRKLRARSWPARFGDVESQIRSLERSQDEAPKTEGRRGR